VAGADLGRARGIRRGPAPRGGGAPPRHTGGRGNTLIIVHFCLGHLYLAQGDLEHAIRVYEQGLALCRASGNRDSLRGIASGLGSAYALQGRLAEGVRCWRRRSAKVSVRARCEIMLAGRMA